MPAVQIGWKLDFRLIWTYSTDFRGDFERLRPSCLAPRRGKAHVFFSPRDPRQDVITTSFCLILSPDLDHRQRSQAVLLLRVEHPAMCLDGSL